MDKKEEDLSEESKRNHIQYYKSLTRVISDIREEMGNEDDQAVKKHLEDRIQAMKKDMERIREMFPEVADEEWENDGSDSS